MRQYLLGNGLTDPTRVSNITGNRLPADVHSALDSIHLSDDVWNDPVRLGAILLETFGDSRSVDD